MRKIKLSTYAKENDICYKTAHSYFTKGFIKGERTPTGTILIHIEEPKENLQENKEQKADS